MGCLLQAVECTKKLADVIGEPTIVVSWWLLHVDLFLKFVVEEGVADI